MMDEIEIIARDVDNYSFWEDGIYVSQYEQDSEDWGEGDF